MDYRNSYATFFGFTQNCIKNKFAFSSDCQIAALTELLTDILILHKINAYTA
jgi:hypothetical protein